MDERVLHGDSLLDVSGKFVNDDLKMAIILIIDGCRADAIYGALNNGDMPKLADFMNLGYVKYENCFTVFPSVTIACHASILTGAYPGDHGIVGNEWFKREDWANPQSGKKIQAV